MGSALIYYIIEKILKMVIGKILKMVLTQTTFSVIIILSVKTENDY